MYNTNKIKECEIPYCSNKKTTRHHIQPQQLKRRSKTMRLCQMHHTMLHQNYTNEQLMDMDEFAQMRAIMGVDTENPMLNRSQRRAILQRIKYKVKYEDSGYPDGINHR